MGKQEFIKGDFAGQFISSGISSMPGGFFIYRADETEELLYANQALLELSECDSFEQLQELTCGSFKGLVFSKDVPAIRKNIREQIQAAENHFDHISFRIRTKHGKVEYVESYGRLVQDPSEGPLYYVFIVDARTRYLAFDMDELTGLPGRRRFLENVSRHLELKNSSSDRECYSFAYINLTEFKALNVRYGVTEGDNVLKAFAGILHAVFPENSISRFSDDHFVVCAKTKGMIEKLERIHDGFVEEKINDIVGLKVGIYHMSDTGDEVTPAVACDLAKYASDYIKNDERSFYCVYHPGIEQKSDLEKYLIRNLDRAISMGHIKVYYQPVVRTLTGDVCGKEALCRWLDPEKGFISPTDFIPVLEKSKIIHKLDNFIVNQVCRDLHEELKEGGFAVPVSFNLSRLDFTLGNPFEEVEAAAREYDIPREFLRVEITETTLMDNPDRTRVEIDRFHSAGYQVWMDDFGSGFSSLNVLKDFDFDEIKIDMLFLSNFNERSKSIIRHTIMMAKDLGVKTLAEGVETKEQFEFLKSIGCQKIQGSYFGKPMAPADIRKNIIKRNMKAETAEERRYFTQVGRVNVITDEALALVEDDGKKFRFYFINDEYKKALSTMGTISIEQAEANLNDRGTALGMAYRNFALQVEMAGEETVFTYMDRGQSMRVIATPIAQNKNKHMLKLQLQNLYIQDTSDRQQMIDTYIRSLMYTYDSADILHLEEDYAEELMRHGSFTNFGSRLNGLESIRNYFADNVVYGDDYERYHAFSDPKNLAERIRRSGQGYIRDDFRFKNIDGVYEWKTVLELLLPNTDKDVVVQFIQDPYKYNGTEARPDQENIPAFWDALMKNTDHCYFWKDSNNRYIGANRAFMDYHRVKSVEEIRGKSDDELGFHTGLTQVYEIEQFTELSKKGEYKNVHLIREKDGLTRRVIASKYPVYEDAKLIGYLGSFDDEDINARFSNILPNSQSVDPVTGLMNAGSAYETELNFYEKYHQQKIDFAVIELEISKFKSSIEILGEETVNELLRMVGEKIREHITRSEAAARIVGSRFVIFSDSSNHNYVLKIVQDIIADIQGINEVNGVECMLTVNVGVAFASEVSDIESLNRTVTNRRMEYAEKHEEKYAVEKVHKDSEINSELRLYYNLPIAVAVFRLIFDEERKKVIDGEFVYVNDRYCKAVNKKESELIGSRFKSSINHADSIWGSYCYRAITENREFHDRTYSKETGIWTEFTVSPSTIAGCCVFTFMNIEDGYENMESLSKNVTTDDRIIRIAKRLISDEPYNDMMNAVLEELSHMIHPERVYILEQDEKYINNTFEWCADGIEPEIDMLQDLDRKMYSGWEEMLNYDTCINIPEVEAIKEDNEVLYELLKKQYINRLIAVPLYDNGKLIGYLGADNYEYSRAIDTRRLLETVAAFIASKIASHQMLSKLHHMSHYDTLTGVHNRNAIFAREKELAKENRTAGIIYLDMNGLKQANDANGHEEGDRRLKETAKVLSDAFGLKNVYRIGGDEFVVILADIHEKEFEREKKRLLNILKDNPELKLSKGFQWCPGTEHIEDAVKSADRKMYEDKNAYYIAHDRRKN
ncbi:diguanylate cyclase (GGDEF) domain-containing protein [Lachnospiraceae bacterium]|nr:diguanylate cyclase (GGDEF) domain-containing protein [Lachnospiraceae bacterium]